MTAQSDTDNLARFSLRRYPQPKMERGFYAASADDMGMGMSRYGTPMVVFSFKLEGTAGAKYLWRVPITQEDIHKLTQVNKAVGLPTPSLPRLLSGDQKLETPYYLGARLLVHLAPEQYQGKWRSTAAEIRPITQSQAFRAVMPKELSL